MIAGILIYKWNGRNNMSIQVDDVIKVLSKIYNFIEDDNIVNEENILNYETDDIEPIRVRIYTESNKFDILKNILLMIGALIVMMILNLIMDIKKIY